MSEDKQSKKKTQRGYLKKKKKEEDKQSPPYRIPPAKANSRLWRWLNCQTGESLKQAGWLPRSDILVNAGLDYNPPSKTEAEELPQKMPDNFGLHTQPDAMCFHTYGNACITQIHVHEKTKKVGKMFLFRPTNAG